MIRRTGVVPLPVPSPDARVQTNVAIPAPGDAELVADLYIPEGRPPFPAVVEITPYGASKQASVGAMYAARGYLFLAVDARGRYRSSGHWEPVINDQQDGHAVIGWLSGHPLCNGRIGSRGHSYSAYNQLLAAIDAPAGLQAMVVAMAPGDPFDNVPYQGGAYNLEDLFWLLGTTGRVCVDDGVVAEEPRPSYFAPPTPPPSYGLREELAYLERHEKEQQEAFEQRWIAALQALPFREVDLRFGVRHEVFREWVAHWKLDAYWRGRSAGPRLDRTAVPTFFLSGWWDVNSRGATRFFRAMRERAATGAARAKQRLLMGPWDHAFEAPDCTYLPPDEKVQIERGAAREALNDEFAWFDAHLMDIPPGPATRSRVTLYVTGLHQWRDFDDWPPAESHPQTWYLAAGGRAGGVLVLEPPAHGAGLSRYRFDPSTPTPFGPRDVAGARAPFDNARIETGRDDLLVFNTPPFAEATALIGEVALVLYAEGDAPDFDLCAKLLDVYPDGRAIYLTDGIVRARFRKGWDRQVMMAPGEIGEFQIDLWHIAHVMRPGHRLRLEIASAALLRFDVNPCTGGDLADETKMGGTEVRVRHDIDHASRLILPVCTDSGLV